MDVDGVLNSTAWFRRRGPAGDGVLLDHAVDPEAMARVNQIWKATLCAVVVSSTWRLSYDRLNQLAHDLRRLGLSAMVVGRTPSLAMEQLARSRPKCRGEEIQAWLDENPVVDSFAILDDDTDMGHLRHRLVRTDFAHGLTDREVKLCIEMLLGDSPGVDCSRVEGGVAAPTGGSLPKSAPARSDAASPPARDRQGRRRL